MKKNIREYIRICGRCIFAGVAVLCWWSMFLPQMVMNENCYRILDSEGRPVAEAEYQATEPDWMEIPTYWEMLEADEDEVVLTGRLWEYFKDLGWVD